MYMCGMGFFGGVARIVLVAVVTRTQDKFTVAVLLKFTGFKQPSAL
jgi:fluoride ion exporter CrcB/FEX